MRLADHQRQAAARAQQLMARFGGVLLADEVGLGKSYVAAEVMREFSGDVEMIIPASLMAQWKATLVDAGVDATILTHDAIAGMPFMPDVSRRRLIVVDEAHAFRNPATQRYAALCRRSIGAELMLVTATPLCNSARDLEALLALIVADDALAGEGVASIDAAFALRDAGAIDAVMSALVIRRSRSVLPDELRFSTAVRRVVRHPVFDGGGRVASLIDGLEFPLVGSAPLLRRLLWRRLESSEAALIESIRRQLRFYDRALDSLARGHVLTKRDYRAAFGDEEDGDPIQQVLFWDLWAAPSADVERAPIVAEVERLTELRNLIEQSACEKRQLLMLQLAKIREPAIIFTTAAATARDLYDAIRTKWRSAVATSRDGRAGVEAFRSGRTDVLVATDLASEGLNLQRAGAIIHYDIPWNPVKLEQRNGRACRIGQLRPEVIAIYFLPRTNVTRIVPTIAAKERLRRKLVRSDAPAASPIDVSSSLPARLAHDAAAARFIAAAEARGLFVPDWLERRHRAGADRLLEEASHEFLDRERLHALLSMIANDCHGGGEGP